MLSFFFADEDAMTREGYLFETRQQAGDRILNKIKGLGSSLMSFLLAQIVCCLCLIARL